MTESDPMIYSHLPKGFPMPPLAAVLLAMLPTRLPALEPPASPAPNQPPLDLPADGGGMFSEFFYLKLGFSFMIGLAMGFALKIAFKIALVVIGLILLALFGLQYAGIVEINWTGLEGHYNGGAEWLGAHAGAFFGFVGDNLTSAASFLAGLALGFKL